MRAYPHAGGLRTKVVLGARIHVVGPGDDEFSVCDGLWARARMVVVGRIEGFDAVLRDRVAPK